MSLEITSNDLQINFKMREVNVQKIYRFENFSLDAAHLLLFKDGEQLSLTPKVLETLLALVEQRGEVLSKDALMDIVWPDSIVEESNLSQNLYLLRKTLGNTKTGRPFIETLRRRGYRFNGDVEVSNGSVKQDAHMAVVETVADELPPQTEIAPVELPPRVLSVEKRGNVLALADWKADEFSPKIEPKTNTAVSDPPMQQQKRKPLLYLAAAAVIVAFLLSVIGLRSLSPNASAVAADDLSISKLTDGENVDSAVISRDGNYFTYVTHDGELSHLWLQQTGNAKRIELTEPFPGVVYATTFTPDSKFIYFVVNEKGSEKNVLYRVPTLGGVKSRILIDVSAAVSFSPDGTEMAFMRGSKETRSASIMIASIDGTSERTLITKTFEEGAMNGGGAWSPDGKTIAWGLVDIKTLDQGACTVVATDVQSGVTTPLSKERWDNCFRMDWTSDARGLVFIGTRMNEALSTRRDQVYYLRLDGGESRRLTTDGSRYQYNSIAVTERDDIFAVSFNRLSQVWSVDESGDARSAVQITKGHADGRGGIVSLADGRIAYLARNGDGFSIWTANSDGSDRKQLTADPAAIEELRAPPDGSFFVFSEKKDGRNHLYRMSANGDRQQLTFGDSYEADSTISPDGNWIVYNSRIQKNNDIWEMTLRKMPSSGGEPMQLSESDCHTPHFSPDGSQISCVSPDWERLIILSADTGEIVKTFKARENPLLNIGAHWTRDGRSLAYIVNQNNTSNIFLQPVDGGDTQPLTDFTNGDIYNFTFASDEPNVFLARGYAVRNALLISNYK